MKNCVAFALLALCIASCHGIVWKDCGSKLSKIKDVSVTGCKDLKVCPLPHGKHVVFTVDFMTNSAASGATAVVHGIIDRVPLPFPFNGTDACADKQCGLHCPLKGSTSYSYHPVIYVDPNFPKVKVIVKWELQDSNTQDIFCVEVASEIIDSENTGKQLNGVQFSNMMPARINPSPIGRNYQRMKNKIQASQFSNKMPKGFNPMSDALKFSNKMPKSINPITEGLKYIRHMPKDKPLMKKLKHIW